MPRARTRENKIYRAISIAEFFAEGGHTVSDAIKEFGVNSTTIKNDLNYLRDTILDHQYSENPEKEKQLIVWYNSAKKNLRQNCGNARVK